jgi:uncharacterized protein (DUF2235 family)
MPKNILIFSDGTGQAGGVRPDQRLSNIYKLYRATRPGPDSPIDPSQQVAFYDPGLGTLSDTDGIRLNVLDKFLSIFGLATGMGITDNIIDCYEAILKHYRPGDRICLFGFSRGAYTARCVASVLRLCGVPTHDGTGKPLPPDGPKLRAIAREAVVNIYERRFQARITERISANESAPLRFRRKYGSLGEDDNSSNVAPAFIGVFDTVAALGARGWRMWLLVFAVTVATALFSAVVGRTINVMLPAFSFWPSAAAVFGATGAFLAFRLLAMRWKARGYDLSLDPRVGYARHARAIDECRADFDVLGWGHSVDVRERESHCAQPPWLQQMWFAGNHSDIGGSYLEEESRLSDIALEWMLTELTARVPVQLDPSKLRIWPSHDGMQHCEVQKSAEQWWRPTWKSIIRKIDPNAPLHESVRARFECEAVPHFREQKKYRPAALAEHNAVKGFY